MKIFDPHAHMISRITDDYEKMSVAGIVGDLIESLLKRDAHTKDSGALLPGMGGLMDRIDSPLLGIPVMYYLLLLSVWLRTGPTPGAMPGVTP